MSYIFLSFHKRLDSNSTNKKDYYSLSLNNQYEKLKKRLPLEKQFSFREFIEGCFQSGFLKRYFFTCPNFLREKKELSKVSYLYNVVIRPEYTPQMEKFLPDNQNVILIGDICEGQKLKVFVVKGIEFIDIGMKSISDKEVTVSACNEFEPNIWSIKNVDYDKTVLTHNFVNDLILSAFTVRDPERVRAVYDEWKKYIDFRHYYLAEQSKRHFLLDCVKYIDSYAISRKEYNSNSSFYEDFLLTNDKEFLKSDMVILNQNLPNTEPFPLIRVDIDRKLKDFNNAKIIKRGNEVNEEEVGIRLLSKDNVYITSINPKEKKKQDKDVTLKNFLDEGYILGDLFKIIVNHILPIDHLEQIDLEYKKKIENAKLTITSKYEKKVSDELQSIINKFKLDQGELITKQLNDEKIKLDNSLEKDVHENSDPNIIQLIEIQKNKIKQGVISKNKISKEESDEDYQARIDFLSNELYENIDIKQYYIDRNTSHLELLEAELNKKLNNDVDNYRKEKYTELNNKYKKDLKYEINKVEYELNQECANEKSKIEEDETIRRLSIYFKLNEQTNPLNENAIRKIEECKYIVYDSRAEQAKINRQENALENFYSGYVKNPYLSSYLFNCKDLPNIPIKDREKGVWYLESLNDKQKEAVRKAVNSNAIFLLQGPPGTGKTQVIAETVAHLVKQGKKVLISSETHKAIDNVFERLPKIPEIVPIRLISSNTKKQENNEFDPTYLVDNFYQNISSNLKKAIERFKNFERNKSDFKDNFNKLKILKSKIDKAKDEKSKLDKEIENLELKAKQIKAQNENVYEDISFLKEKIDRLKRTKRYVEKNRNEFDEDIEKDFIYNFNKEISDLFKDKETYTEIDSSQFNNILTNIFKLTDTIIEDELDSIDPNSNKVNLEIKKETLKQEISKYIDEIGEIINEADRDTVQNLKEEFKSIDKKLKDLSNDGIPVTDLLLGTFFNFDFILNKKNEINKEIKTLQAKICDVKNKIIEDIEKEESNYAKRLDLLESKKEQVSIELNRIDQQIIEIEEKNEYQEIQRNETLLHNQLNAFFKEFEIFEPYKDVSNAFIIIENKWREIEKDYSKKEFENKEKIPMYTKILNYLSSSDVIENDRKYYTKDLFDNANVFGITCTANDRFNSSNINAFGEFGLEDLDIKSVGIDVVIIDEVSKSSFIDLLIPILYGKTIILVGDHRQLPPMYEFKNIRDDELKGLDENIINPTINKNFTKMYEECLFKTLFEQISDDYKTMLTKQYRCHEQIMKVFNHFYQNQLELGFSGQNNLKQHNIRIHSNGRNIIDPSRHIYFVDCKRNETHEQDSTSMYNSGEADVVVSLIKKINKFLKNNQDTEKLTIGVICTYSDQAKIIREKIKNEKIKTDGFDTKTERMVVSTVDDFQGDERDIIILSMVRNPEKPNKSNPGFILAYQRINVALSRARKLLIMVGNKSYLENKGIIDLPDIYGKGNDRRGFRVYENIISTIEQEGKIIDDIDVISDKEKIIYG